jgi:hypothetical protein
VLRPKLCFRIPRLIRRSEWKKNIGRGFVSPPFSRKKAESPRIPPAHGEIPDVEDAANAVDLVGIRVGDAAAKLPEAERQ